MVEETQADQSPAPAQSEVAVAAEKATAASLLERLEGLEREIAELKAFVRPVRLCCASALYSVYFVLSLLVLLVATVLGLRERVALRVGRDIVVPSSLAGRNVLVTGSTAGIGFEAAKLFCERGAGVVVHGPSEERTRRAAARVQAAGAGRVTALHADLGDFDEVRRLARDVGDLFSKVHYLVLNAALLYGLGTNYGKEARAAIYSLPDSYFVSKSGHDRVMAVNHFGHFLLTKLLRPKFAPGVSIVVVSSQASWLGDWHRVVSPTRVRWEAKERRHLVHEAYHDSKLANVCFVRALRARLKSGSVVNFDPGLVNTAGAANRSSARYRNEAWYKKVDERWIEWQAPTEEGGLNLFNAAFIAKRPMPDTVYAYWLPAEVMRWYKESSTYALRKKRQLPWRFQKNQVWTWGLLYGGVGPDCGRNEGFAKFYHWDYSLNATGLPGANRWGELVL